MACHPGSVGRDHSSLAARSPAPPPNLGFCGLSKGKLSVRQAAHFSPGHTGDHVPGLLILHQLDVVRGELQAPGNGGVTRSLP